MGTGPKSPPPFQPYASTSGSFSVFLIRKYSKFQYGNIFSNSAVCVHEWWLFRSKGRAIRTYFFILGLSQSRSLECSTVVRRQFRDINGDLIPANSCRIPLLEYGYVIKIVNMSMDMGQNLH
jgi:hypothetical protein